MNRRLTIVAAWTAAAVLAAVTLALWVQLAPLQDEAAAREAAQEAGRVAVARCVDRLTAMQFQVPPRAVLLHDTPGTFFFSDDAKLVQRRLDVDTAKAEFVNHRQDLPEVRVGLVVSYVVRQIIDELAQDGPRVTLWANQPQDTGAKGTSSVAVVSLPYGLVVVSGSYLMTDRQSREMGHVVEIGILGSLHSTPVPQAGRDHSIPELPRI